MRITKDYLKRIIKEELDQISAKKVWVVIEDYAYEGQKVVAVFDSEEGADAHAKELDEESGSSAYIVEEFILNQQGEKIR